MFKLSNSWLDLHCRWDAATVSRLLQAICHQVQSGSKRPPLNSSNTAAFVLIVRVAAQSVAEHDAHATTPSSWREGVDQAVALQHPHCSSPTKIHGFGPGLFRTASGQQVIDGEALEKVTRWNHTRLANDDDVDNLKAYA